MMKVWVEAIQRGYQKFRRNRQYQLRMKIADQLSRRDRAELQIIAKRLDIQGRSKLVNKTELTKGILTYPPRSVDKLLHPWRRVFGWVGVAGTLATALGILGYFNLQPSSGTDKKISEIAQAVKDEAELKVVEIEQLSRELAAALERVRRLEFSVTSIGMTASRKAAAAPEVEELAERLALLIDTFDDEYDELTLSESLLERVIIARALEYNARSRFSDTLQIVTAEAATREDRAAEYQATRAFEVNSVRGDAMRGLQQWENAADHYRRALRWQPGHPAAKSRLAECLFNSGDLTQALSVQSELVSSYALSAAEDPLGDRAADIAASLNSRSVILDALRRDKEALEDNNQAIDILLQLVGSDDESPHAGVLAASLSNRGKYYTRVGRLEEALVDYQQAIGMMNRRLENQDRPERAYALAIALGNRGSVLNKLNRSGEALDDSDRALGLLGRLRNENELADVVAAVGTTSTVRGDAYFGLKMWDEAFEEYGDGVQILTRLVEDRGRTEFEGDLARVLDIRANAYSRRGRFNDAIDSYSREVILWEKIVQDSGRSEPRNKLANALGNRGNSFSQMGHIDKAMNDYDESIRIQSELEKLEESSAVADNLATTLSNRGALLNQLERYEESVGDCRRAVDLLDHMINNEGRGELNGDLVTVLNNLGVSLTGLDRYEESIREFDRAIEILSSIPKNIIPPEYQDYLALILVNRGNSRLSHGDPAKALEDYGLGIGIRVHLVETEGQLEYASGLALSLFNRAFVLHQLERNGEATRDCQTALRWISMPEILKTVETENIKIKLENLMKELEDGG